MLADVLGQQLLSASRLQHLDLDIFLMSALVYDYNYFVICGEVYQICCIIIEFISTNFKSIFADLIIKIVIYGQILKNHF